MRLTGCHIRCSYCDTGYAFYEVERKSIDDVIAQVLDFGCPLVEITGGEPLLQKGCFPLARRLIEEGLTVLVETSGCVDVGGLDRRAVKIMDIKTPSSGEADKNVWANLEKLEPHDEIKFVIGDRADYDWAAGVLKEHDLAERHVVHFSHVFEKLDLTDLAAWVLADGLPVRVATQLHKLIWPGVERGV